jgi:hypothetical protein
VFAESGDSARTRILTGERDARERSRAPRRSTGTDANAPVARRRRAQPSPSHRHQTLRERTMFATTKKLLFAAVTVMSLTVPAVAQGTFGNLGNLGNLGSILIPPTLPPLEWRANSYDRGIGNTWLGGSVHTYANIVRQKQGSYELGNAQAEFRGTATVLKLSKEVAEILGSATNIMNNGVQQRSGQFRVELLGMTVINQSFTSNSTFAASQTTFNLIPGGVSASVPVGPISVTLSGNAGCSFGRSANWLLPAATASVGLNASANAYAFANASVSFGIPGFNVGVGIQGRILEQYLSGNVNANASWGLSGSVNYQLRAITLQLYAWATALYTWTTNLCSWSAGVVSFNLI